MCVGNVPDVGAPPVPETDRAAHSEGSRVELRVVGRGALSSWRIRDHHQEEGHRIAV
jgi:hypothetical protein